MMPVATEKCINNCGRPPGGTPWLCLQCLRAIVRDVVTREERGADTEVIERLVKSRLNKIQRKTRRKLAMEMMPKQ